MRVAVVLLVLLPALAAGQQAQSSKVCATCHAKEYNSQIHTSMARAMEPIADCIILKDNPNLTFHDGIYSYTITRQGTNTSYSVTDGQNTLTVPLEYAFGLGDAGQTYVFSYKGNMYESRVSFFDALNGLDLTLGARSLKATNLEEAAGRLMHRREIGECFGCHTTGLGPAFNFAHVTPGVTCEHCHGSAEAHVNGFAQGKPVPMRHLSTFSAEDTSDFCGQCHRTWAQIAANGPHDINNVRFQPYRLANSKCYDPSDRRISCVACHDPHVQVVRSDTFYDPKCLACHPSAAHPVAGKAGARRCPVAADRCVSCHMTRYEIPGSHFRFFDHDIRVAKNPADYPE